MNEETANILAAAIAAAHGRVRRLPGVTDLESHVRETMDARYIDPTNFAAVMTIADALVGFADAVRVAERKDHPILRYHDEEIPSR